jgi:hypothetical protein
MQHDAERLRIGSEDDELAGTTGDAVGNRLVVARQVAMDGACTYDLVASLAPFLSWR